MNEELDKKRKISSEVSLLNLYIRYKRDFIQDDSFVNIKAVKHESFPRMLLYETLGNEFNVYKEDEKYYQAKSSYENESDGRKKKTKKKEYEKKKKVHEKFQNLKRIGKIIDCIDDLNMNSNPFDSLNNNKKINIPINGYSSIQIDGTNIDYKDLHQFDCDINITANFFGLDIGKGNVLNLILSITRDKMLEFLEINGFHTQLNLWKKDCKKIDLAFTSLKNNSYCKQSKQKALEYCSETSKAYWLLQKMIRYEEVTNKTIPLNKNYLKSIAFHHFFEKWFDFKTSRKIVKNSTLSKQIR